MTEDVIRQDLRLDDADRVECLPTKEIFTELARMGYEKPPPKLTFYKAFFSAQWKVGKGFSGVETPLFASMLVQPQPQAAKEEDDVEVPAAPTPPSLTTTPSPTPQDPILTPLQDQPATPSSPPQEQPTSPHDYTIPLLTTLLETCATLSQKVALLEQDKITQALEILKLKKRDKKLEKKRRSKSSSLKRLRKVGEKIKAIDVDEDITLVDAETKVDMDAELQGRINDVSVVATKDVNDAEPTMAKRLHDKEVEKAAAKEEQEKDDLEKAKGLQQYLKRKPVSIAQARKNMIIYLKNMVGYKMEHFRGSRTYWKIIRVGGITKVYQSFEDMLNGFDREDLVALWSLVKEKFSTAVPTVDKEKALWVELKRLFKLDIDDVMWKLQRLMLLGKDDSATEGLKKLL
nr:hypothetical protein [Tanacetum cinerariifolium]